MNAQRRSVPEAGAYRMVQSGLIELKVGRAELDDHRATRPDADRATDLAAIRAAVAQLKTSVHPLPL
jgi:hypothetical protein